MSLGIYGAPAAGVGFTNTSPPVVTGYPFVMGAWGQFLGTLGGGAAVMMVSIGQAAVSRNSFSIGILNNNVIVNWFMSADNGTQFENLQTATALSNGEWAYVVARFISATNHRLAIWRYGVGSVAGQYETASGVTSVPISVNFTRQTIGFRADTTSQPWGPGFIQDVWFADADIYDSTLDLPFSFVAQLARHGPLSIPNVAYHLIDYLPLRNNNSNSGLDRRSGTFFSSKYGPQTWSAVTGTVPVTEGPSVDGVYTTSARPLIRPFNRKNFYASTISAIRKFPPFNLRAV